MRERERERTGARPIIITTRDLPPTPNATPPPSPNKNHKTSPKTENSHQKTKTKDGFPRTVAQAKALDALLEAKGKHLDAVLNFRVDDAVLVERITGRLVHPASGRSYHEKFAPPKVPMRDDATGEPLVRRRDDTAETLVARLRAFHEQTSPLVAYYGKKVADVEAARPQAEVAAQVRRALS